MTPMSMKTSTKKVMFVLSAVALNATAATASQVPFDRLTQKVGFRILDIEKIYNDNFTKVLKQSDFMLDPEDLGCRIVRYNGNGNLRRESNIFDINDYVNEKFNLGNMQWNTNSTKQGYSDYNGVEYKSLIISGTYTQNVVSMGIKRLSKPSDECNLIFRVKPTSLKFTSVWIDLGDKWAAKLSSSMAGRADEFFLFAK